MNRMYICIILCVLLQTMASSLEFSECTSEEQALEWIRSKLETKEKINKNVISIAVQRSWWTAAEHIVKVAQEQKVDISSPFARSSAIIKSHLQKIQNMINSNRNDWSIIPPTFQWAQGMNDVNVNVKYAHKWDTPATLGCSVHNITFSEKSVYVESKCPSTKKKFVLKLGLMKEINPEESHWNDASVGRVVLMMKKKERGHWENILAGEKIPRNMHTWWSMKDQLEKEDEASRKSEEKKREEEDKKKREEERKKEEETKQKEEEEKANQREKEVKDAVKEASKAAEEDMKNKKEQTVEVKHDGTVN